jgi:predicted NACHT family NTPase
LIVSDNSWATTAPRSFPVGTRISQVYDAANGELLLLGAPGSGKTTLLLELTRALLDRAQQDEHQQMPVVFPLSSWAAKQLPLSAWMVEELVDKYDVPPPLARSWVDTH